MPRTSQIRPDVIASAIRTMREALTEAKQAVYAWRDVDEGGRFDVANGMLILLGEIVADKDGEDTLNVVGELLEQYNDRLFDTQPHRLALLQRLGQLATEARILDQLVRANEGDVEQPAAEDLAKAEQMLASTVADLDSFFNTLEMDAHAQADANDIAVTLRRVKSLLTEARCKLS